MNVRKMLTEELSAGDLETWRAWYAAEPRGEERGDMQAGLIARQAYIGAQVIKEGEKAPKPEHFAALLRESWAIPLTPAEKSKARKLEKSRKRAKARKDFRRMAEQMNSRNGAKS